jgi:hypothetical protein
MQQLSKVWMPSVVSDPDFEEEVRAYLQQITDDQAEHARFLNMLAMLEHIGSRKILQSQHPILTEKTRRHLAEEVRHAHFFKRHADQFSAQRTAGYDPTNTTAYHAARMYFGRLDVTVARHVGPKNAYPWVSMVVELRACWFYKLYHQVLQTLTPRLSLAMVLAEEAQHLGELFESCGQDQQRLHELSAQEQKLFDNLWMAIKSNVGVNSRDV